MVSLTLKLNNNIKKLKPNDVSENLKNSLENTNDKSGFSKDTDLDYKLQIDKTKTTVKKFLINNLNKKFFIRLFIAVLLYIIAILFYKYTMLSIKTSTLNTIKSLPSLIFKNFSKDVADLTQNKITEVSSIFKPAEPVTARKIPNWIYGVTSGFLVMGILFSIFQDWITPKLPEFLKENFEKHRAHKHISNLQEINKMKLKHQELLQKKMTELFTRYKTLDKEDSTLPVVREKTKIEYLLKQAYHEYIFECTKIYETSAQIANIQLTLSNEIGNNEKTLLNLISEHAVLNAKYFYCRWALESHYNSKKLTQSQYDSQKEKLSIIEKQIQTVDEKIKASSPELIKTNSTIVNLLESYKEIEDRVINPINSLPNDEFNIEDYAVKIDANIWRWLENRDGKVDKIDTAEELLTIKDSININKTKERGESFTMSEDKNSHEIKKTQYGPHMRKEDNDEREL